MTWLALILIPVHIACLWGIWRNGIATGRSRAVIDLAGAASIADDITRLRPGRTITIHRLDREHIVVSTPIRQKEQP